MSQRYNTGNPRPSNSMKDLNDNALAYDDFINSDADEAVDRFSKPFPTVRKQVADRIDELVGASQNAIESAEIATAAAENVLLLSHLYTSVAEAQADITAGTIPLNAMFNVAVPVGAIPPRFADQYQNVAGVATLTRQTIVSGKAVDLLAVLVAHINSILTAIVPPGYKVTWNDSLGNFSVGIKDDGALVSGSSEIAGVKIGADINGNAVAFYDTLLNACVAITSSGLLRAGSASINNLSALINLSMPDGSTLNKVLPDGFVLAFMNTYKEAVAGIKNNGTLVLGSAKQTKLQQLR